MRKELNRPNLLPEVSSSVGVIQKLYQVQLNTQLNTKKSKHNKYHGIISHKSWRKCGIGITTSLEMVSPNFLNVTKTSDDFYEFVFWVSDFSKTLCFKLLIFIFFGCFLVLICIWIWMQITSKTRPAMCLFLWNSERSYRNSRPALIRKSLMLMNTEQWHDHVWWLPPIVACCKWATNAICKMHLVFIFY